MAGGPWQFTVSPNTINTVIITQSSTTVTVTKSNGEFYTNAFAETSTVTISATGYQAVTVTAGTTSTITMTPIFSSLITILVDENNKPIIFDNQPIAIITLPSEYTKLDYIASTGTQHIDTGVIPTSNDLVYDWEGRDDNTSGYTSLFSSEYAVGGDYSNRDFGGVLHGTRSSRPIYLGKTTGMGIGYSSTDNEFHKWSLVINSNHKVYLVKDGTKLTEYTWTGELNRYNSIALFCNHTTSSFSQKASVAYKYFRIKNESGWLFWGIPAKRNSDSALGMYDLITKQFFTNAGTGTFVEG